MHTLQSKLMPDDEQRVAEELPPAYVVSEAFARSDSKRSALTSEPVGDDLLQRLQTIVGAQGIDTTQRLSRDAVHARTSR